MSGRELDETAEDTLAASDDALAAHRRGRYSDVAQSEGGAPSPADQLLDVKLVLGRPMAKWRRYQNGWLGCPMCGCPIPPHSRAIAQHVEHHLHLERIRIAGGLPPAELITVDYARAHERAMAHAVTWCAVALAAMLALAVVIVAVVL